MSEDKFSLNPERIINCENCNTGFKLKIWEKNKHICANCSEEQKVLIMRSPTEMIKIDLKKKLSDFNMEQLEAFRDGIGSVQSIISCGLKINTNPEQIMCAVMLKVNLYIEVLKELNVPPANK